MGGDVARAIKRPPQYTTKRFGCELGAQSTYTNKEGEGERAIVNGAHDTAKFQELLDKFLEKYVLCENCKLPEIDMGVKKGVIKGGCKACGWSGELDNCHKLATFIQKNPPQDGGMSIAVLDEGTGAKLDKKARQQAKAEKARKAAEGEEDDDDDDGSQHSSLKKEKKEKKDKKEKKEKKE